MCCYDFFKDIIIPLLAAILGGALTFGGVIITIRHEKEKDIQNSIKAVRPWIYSVDDCNTEEYKKTHEIYLSTNGNLNNNRKKTILVKNTDNGIGIVEKMQTEKKTYYPIYSKVLEKNTYTFLYIDLEAGETLKDMKLIIKDVYGNPYEYRVVQTDTNHNYWAIEEVKQNDSTNNLLIKEVENNR